MSAAVAAPLSDLQGLGLAWARFAPTLAIVPAFGLRDHTVARSFHLSRVI